VARKIYSLLLPFLPTPVRRFLRYILYNLPWLPLVPFAIRRAKVASRRENRDPRLAVFVAYHPNTRVAKLAYGLRSAGWKVVLLYGNEPNFDATRYFDEAKRYRSPWQALLVASRYAARVYHVFSLSVDETAVTFVRHKPGRVVYDAVGGIEGIFNGPNWPRAIPKQRYCIENTDGLCCRDLQIPYVTRKFGYKRPREVIFFPDYCWDFSEDSEPTVPRNSDEIHVVLMGSFGIEKLGETEAGYLDVAERFAEQGIHFHIYHRDLGWSKTRNMQFNEIFSDYIALSQRTPFFHLHKSVPLEEVVSELRKYDIGISVVRAKIYGESVSTFTDNHLRLCGSLRIMDYLDAGLPVIISKEHKFQYSMLARYGLAVSATAEMLDNARERINSFLSPDLKQKLREARSRYSGRRHTGRLIAFYEGL